MSGDFMTDKYAFKFAVISFYALALAIFISVSLLSVYHLLTLITFLILLMRKKINLKNLPQSAWALLIFIGSQLLSAAVNFSELEDKFRSIGGIKYPLVGIIGLLIFRNQQLQNDEFFKKHSRIIFNIFLATIIIAFSYGFSKVYIGFDLLDANDYQLILNKNHILPIESNFRLGGLTDIMRYGYGSAVVLLVLLAIALNINKFPKLNKTYLWVSLSIGFTGLFMSYTRGAMLGFLIGFPIVFLYFNKYWGAVAALISAVAISLMITVPLMGGSEKSRFLLGANSTSNNERMSQYLSAIHAFEERPIFGFGPQQLKFHVKTIKEKYNIEHKHYIEHAHNVYLEIAANTGIIGLFTFLAWIGLWFKELYFQHNTLAKQMFFPVILFLLVSGQFEMLLMAQTSTLIYFLYAINHLNIFQKKLYDR